MVLVSQRTGREVPFVVTETHTDAEGDVMQWVLRPEGWKNARIDTIMRVFND